MDKSNLSTKIEANDRTLLEVLGEKKYIIDYFQREYRWQEEHIIQLVTDLTSTFIDEYTDGDPRTKVASYNSYYLGPFVISMKEGNRSIIDGQQRLTSLTLFLIYLNNIQKELDFTESLDGLIFSAQFGEKSFNLNVAERYNCMKELYEVGIYNYNEFDDESTINMVERYEDINKAFPADLKSPILLHFIDWIKHKVILVEIVAHSDDNAYTIFETMNDRGLNLNNSEMLKGYLLSRFSNIDQRQMANEFWKKSMQTLLENDDYEDDFFFQSWFRGQYALSIRQGKANSKNEDFEIIGTRFHTWFKDNLEKICIKENNPKDFEIFFNEDFKFFISAYKYILEGEAKITPHLEQVYYLKALTTAQSLTYPLMLAPLNKGDDIITVKEKINLVAKYIECFCIRRLFVGKNFNVNSISYTMNTLVKEIRNKSIENLRTIFEEKLKNFDSDLNLFNEFRLRGLNKIFIKYILSRITAFVENESGIHSTFSQYFQKQPKLKPYEIEHIWANNYELHKHEFSEVKDFDEYRNRLGGLLLLQQGQNQSYNDMTFETKKPHYIKNNLLASSLCHEIYENNPNFKNMINKYKFNFKPIEHFNKKEIENRQELYKNIAMEIWKM